MKRSFVLLAAVSWCLAAVSARAEMKSKYNVDFYGYVKLDAFYEHGFGIMDNYLLYNPPSNTCGLNAACTEDQIQNGRRDSLGMTARQTRIGIVVTGPATEGGISTRGRIEADFFGTGVARSSASNQDPEEGKGLLTLRRAFLEIIGRNWEILAGSEWMVVSPLLPMTNNYIYGADAGNLGHRVPQVRLTGYLLDRKLMFQVAAANKIGDVDNLDIDTGRMSAMPSWEAGVTWKDPQLTLAFTGHYGQEMVRTTRHGNFGLYGDRVDSWSTNVSAIIPLGDVASLTGEWYMGANLDGCYTGGQGNGWVVTEDGDREALESTGGWVQFMVAPIPAIRVYATFGIDDVNDDQLRNAVLEPGYIDGDPNTAGNQPKSGNSAITKNYYYSGMVDFYVNPATKISLEYMQMISDYALANNGLSDPNWTPVDWAPGKVDRWTLSFWYMF